MIAGGSYTCRRLVRFEIFSERVPDKDWLGAPLQIWEKEKIGLEDICERWLQE